MMELNSFTCWVILYAFLSSADLFKKKSKNLFRNTIRVSNNLNPDQAQPFVYPDLGPNCLQRYKQMALAGKELRYPTPMWDAKHNNID